MLLSFRLEADLYSSNSRRKFSWTSPQVIERSRELEANNLITDCGTHTRFQPRPLLGTNMARLSKRWLWNARGRKGTVRRRRDLLALYKIILERRRRRIGNAKARNATPGAETARRIIEFKRWCDEVGIKLHPEVTQLKV